MISTAPIRFTENIEELRKFFEILGFKTHMVSERPGWVEMRGDVGSINLHGAEREESSVGFETDEPLETLQTRLHRAGFNDAHIVDAAWGRTLTVTDPQGQSVWINERMRDTYGYRGVD